MKWAKEWWGAFGRAAGRRPITFGGIFALALASFDWLRPHLMDAGISAIIGMPSWAFAIIVFLGFSVYWLLARLVTIERRMTGARAELARLRTTGVDLRNKGRDLKASCLSWTEWEQSVLDWEREVIERLKTISEADAEWFSVLDVVPEPRLEILRLAPSGPDQEPHAKLYREHDFRLRRLGKMIYSLWRE